MKTTIFTTLVNIFVTLNWAEIQGAPKANVGSNCPEVRETIKKRFRRAAFNTGGNTPDGYDLAHVYPCSLMKAVIQNAKDGIITPTQLQNFILWLFTPDANAYVSEKFINANLGVIKHTGKLKNGQLLKSVFLIALYRCAKINPYFKFKLFDQSVIHITINYVLRLFFYARINPDPDDEGT